MMKGQSAVLYLDFVKDIEEVVEVLRQGGIKGEKHTGQMIVEDRKQAEKSFLQGDILVLVATESYKLGRAGQYDGIIVIPRYVNSPILIPKLFVQYNFIMIDIIAIKL